MVTRNNILDRLVLYNLEADSSDYDAIDYELAETLNYVKNYCNITTIPEILDKRIIDKVCATFLANKKNTGNLTDFDYDSVVKQIKEGDTTVIYAVEGSTPESRFDAFIKSLDRGFDKWITPFRALRW